MFDTKSIPVSSAQMRLDSLRAKYSTATPVATPVSPAAPVAPRTPTPVAPKTQQIDTTTGPALLAMSKDIEAVSTRLRTQENLAAQHNEAIERIDRRTASTEDYQKAQGKEISKIGEAVEKLEAAAARTVTFKFDTCPPVTVKDARPELEAMARKVSQGFVNLWLSGPAGVGKTTIAKTLATALGRRFGFQSFSADSSKGEIIGRVDAHGKYHESSFVDFYENGGVYLLDEIDACPGEILLCINAATANGHLALSNHTDPKRRIITRHKECVIVAAANTWGTGATAEYCGRSAIDAATLDRFVGARFAIGYDPALETAILPDSEIREKIWTLRRLVQTHKIRRVVSTRAIEAAAKMHAGETSTEDIMHELVVGWTSEEIAKVKDAL